VQDSQQAPSYTVPEMDQIADYKVSRRVGYALTLKTAPAFSFGIKKDHIPSGFGIEDAPSMTQSTREWRGQPTEACYCLCLHPMLASFCLLAELSTGYLSLLYR
jgi:hypothetical protein